MKRKELVKGITERTTLTKREVEEVMDVMPQIIMEALARGERVMLRGFLCMDTFDSKEKVMFNPHTHEYEKFDARKVVRCKVGKPFQDAVNDREVEEL